MEDMTNTSRHTYLFSKQARNLLNLKIHHEQTQGQASSAKTHGTLLKAIGSLQEGEKDIAAELQEGEGQGEETAKRPRPFVFMEPKVILSFSPFLSPPTQSSSLAFIEHLQYARHST